LCNVNQHVRDSVLHHLQEWTGETPLELVNLVQGFCGLVSHLLPHFSFLILVGLWKNK
jgi:hypothetical protein